MGTEAVRMFTMVIKVISRRGFETFCDFYSDSCCVQDGTEEFHSLRSMKASFYEGTF